VNTGEQNLTLGGAIAACQFSGMTSGSAPVAVGAVVAGSDTLFFSGAGRLKDVVLHQAPLSGTIILFYDTGTAIASGGPFPLSGHKVIGAIENSVLSGGVGALPGTLFAFDVPFTSGLAANVTALPPGFTVTYTPEANPSLINPG